MPHSKKVGTALKNLLQMCPALVNKVFLPVGEPTPHSTSVNSSVHNL